MGLAVTLIATTGLLMAGCRGPIVAGVGATDDRALVVDTGAGRVGDIRLGDPPSAAAGTFGPGHSDLNLGGDPWAPILPRASAPRSTTRSRLPATSRCGSAVARPSRLTSASAR